MKGIGRRIMIVLKWLLIAGLLLYGGGLAFLFFQQRSMLFPIPPVVRMAPPNGKNSPCLLSICSAKGRTELISASQSAFGLFTAVHPWIFVGSRLHGACVYRGNHD